MKAALRCRDTLAGVFLGILLLQGAVGADDASTRVVSHVNKTHERSQIPGIVVAVVRASEIDTVHAVGVGRAGSDELLHERSVFPIGSLTKLFTATALAIEVDRGTLNLRTSVATLWPAWTLRDPVVARKVSVLDLLAHRVGIERGDALWSICGYDKTEVLKRIRFLDLPTQYGSYRYSNLNYLVAGEVLHSVSGRSWSEYLGKELFRPLGMTHTYASFQTGSQVATVISCHEVTGPVVRAVPLEDTDAVAPAISVFSCGNDLARWMIAHLDEGRYRGKAIWSRSVARALSNEHGEINSSESAGLGWVIGKWDGYKTMGHGGAVRGVTTYMLLAPEKGVGVVVLANLGGTAVPNALAYDVLDLVLGKGLRDKAGVACRTERKLYAIDPSTFPKRPTQDLPNPVSLSDYTGEFVHSAYGSLIVREREESLEVKIGNREWRRLRHLWHTSFSLRESRPVTRLAFGLDSRGRIQRATLETDEQLTFSRPTTRRKERLAKAKERLAKARKELEEFRRDR